MTCKRIYLALKMFVNIYFSTQFFSFLLYSMIPYDIPKYIEKKKQEKKTKKREKSGRKKQPTEFNGFVIEVLHSKQIFLCTLNDICK